MEGHWIYLGTACLRNETHSAKPFLEISTPPQVFKQFLSSSSFWAIYILRYSVAFPMAHIRIDEVGEPEFETSVTISFDYTCTFALRNGAVITDINPDNAAIISKSAHFWANLESLNPKFVKLQFRPYNVHDYGHELEVDIDVYYHWQEDPVLHLRMKQDSIPFIPMEFSISKDSPSNLLGVDLLDRRRQMINELRFDRINGFLDSLPRGRMRDTILGGFGVRVSNVYINDFDQPPRTHGLQLKVRRHKDNSPFLVLSLGQVLQIIDFRGKSIEVYYKWKGEFLEVCMKEEPNY